MIFISSANHISMTCYSLKPEISGYPIPLSEEQENDIIEVLKKKLDNKKQLCKDFASCLNFKED